MRTIETGIPGLLIVEPTVFGDERGWFMETHSAPKFEALGIITGDTSPEFAAKFLDDEVVKWSRVISAAGVKAE